MVCLVSNPGVPGLVGAQLRRLTHGEGDVVVDELSVGDRVEVRRRFDAQWARGFEIVEITDADTIRVMRVSDGEVLPAEFEANDIRKAHKRSNDFWWM